MFLIILLACTQKPTTTPPEWVSISHRGGTVLMNGTVAVDGIASLTNVGKSGSYELGVSDGLVVSYPNCSGFDVVTSVQFQARFEQVSGRCWLNLTRR